MTVYLFSELTGLENFVYPVLRRILRFVPCLQNLRKSILKLGTQTASFCLKLRTTLKSICKKHKHKSTKLVQYVISRYNNTQRGYHSWLMSYIGHSFITICATRINPKKGNTFIYVGTYNIMFMCLSTYYVRIKYIIHMERILIIFEIWVKQRISAALQIKYTIWTVHSREIILIYSK